MTTKAAASQRFPLDHLMECSQCGVPMRLEDGPDPVYTCPGSPDQTEPCQAPALRAEDLNRHLLGQVMSAIITDSTFPGFRAEVGGALAEAGQDPPEEDELRRNAVEPEWLLAEPEAGAVLSRFIDRIRVEPRAALVEYRLPLPQGTPLAGAVRQDISLPESLLA